MHVSIGKWKQQPVLYVTLCSESIKIFVCESV